jgi:hypothetical protein
MVNLSLALWCSALQIRSASDHRLLTSGLNLADESDLALAHLKLQERGPFGRFVRLLDFANACLAVTAQGTGPHLSGPNFTADALARDVAATAAASVVLGYHLLIVRHKIDPGEEITSGVIATLKSAGRALAYDFGSLSAPTLLSRDLSSSIDELTHLCAMIWHSFGMDQLRHFATIRRAHFNVLCLRTSVDKADRLMLESEGAVIDRKDFLGLLANSVTADCMLEAAELAAFYLSRAAEIALGGDFGRSLQDEFAQIAIEQGHTLGIDLHRFVEHLLGRNGGQNLVAGIFAGASADDLSAVANRYINAARGSARSSVLNALQAELDKRAPGPELEPARALLDLHRLEEALNGARTVYVEAELSNWQPREHVWVYPSVLRILRSRQRKSEALYHACLWTLDHDAWLDTSNTCLLLAATMAQEFDDNQSRGSRIVAAYLATGIKRWVRRLTAEMNVQIYQSLCRLEPHNRAAYTQDLVHWLHVQLHRDHLRRFPQMLAQRRFFLIFADYFRAIQFWGLEADCESRQLQKMLSADEGSRRKSVAEWKTRGGNTLPAILPRRASAKVSSEFLAIGTYLFEEPFESEDSFTEDRANFNAEAERSLFKLLQIIVTLPELPASIKELLRRYTERLYRYSLPPDLSETPSETAAAAG